MTRTFQHGDGVVLRYVSPVDGEKFDRAQVAYVVEDSAERTVLFVAAGSSYRQPDQTRKSSVDDQTASGFSTDFTDKTWNNWSIIRIMYPGVPYSVWAMYRAQTGEFVRWYVNIEEPFKRTSVGFDVVDFELDVVAGPDLSWSWKDEDHLAKMVSDGIFTKTQASEFREFGLDAIERIEQRTAPFNEPWPQWRPDPSWGPLKMPADDAVWLG